MRGEERTGGRGQERTREDRESSLEARRDRGRSPPPPRERSGRAPTPGAHWRPVPFVSQGERTYHAFYQMCRGCTAEQKQSLRLLPPEEFKYFGTSPALKVSHDAHRRTRVLARPTSPLLRLLARLSRAQA